MRTTQATLTTSAVTAYSLFGGAERASYVLLQAPSSNTANVLFGSRALAPLAAGTNILLPSCDLRDLYLAAASSTQVVYIHAF